MAETFVKEKVCGACGADIRPDSMFCYNCGGSLAAEPVKKSKKGKKTKVSDAWFKEDLTESQSLETTRLEPLAETSAVEQSEEKPIPKPDVFEEAKLKTAANLRRKGKVFQPKTVEVVWEEPDKAPHAWFVLAALVLVLLVLLIWFLANYLK